MSVLHREESDGRVIEVRNAGRTRRLYVDGVLHTAWNPSRPLTGSVWDPLALGAYAAEPGSVRRVLLLGVGGGAAVHLLRRHVQPDEIVAVDLDGRLLAAAERWFGLQSTADGGGDLELVHADAAMWLDEHPRRRFDLVIDDLFGEEDGDPVRAATLGHGWWRRLARSVAPGGVMIVNFPELWELEQSALCQDVSLRERFPSAVAFLFPQLENAVAVLAPRPLTPRQLRAAINRVPSLQSAAARRQMTFRLTALWPR